MFLVRWFQPNRLAQSSRPIVSPMTNPFFNSNALKLCFLFAPLVIAGCAVSPANSRGLSAAATGTVVSVPVGSAVGDGGGQSIGARNLTAGSEVVVTPWKGAVRNGYEITTEHFEIRTTIRNGDLRRFMPIFTECALLQYTNALVPLPGPSKKLQTFIFGTRDEWITFTRDRLGGDADTYLGLGRGGYTTQSVAILYDIGPTDTLTILAHEGWHQYSQSVFREELPVWLEEGIATYMEGYRVDPSGRPIFAAWRNFERFDELRDTVRRDALIPLDQLLDRTPQQFLSDGRNQLLTYYAQVWALTHFLAEGADGKYRSALAQILSDAVDGRIGQSLAQRMTTPEDRRSIERAIRRGGIRSLPGTLLARGYFSENLQEMANDYQAFITKMCERGSGDAIWRGVSPLVRRSQSTKPTTAATATTSTTSTTPTTPTTPTTAAPAAASPPR